MWKIAHKTAVVPVPLMCRLRMHRWVGLAMTSGFRKRMGTGRRGCSACGRVEHQTTAFPGQPWWWLWGYCCPDDLTLSPDEFQAKYVVRDDTVLG